MKTAFKLLQTDRRLVVNGTISDQRNLKRRVETGNSIVLAKMLVKRQRNSRKHEFLRVRSLPRCAWDHIRRKSAGFLAVRYNLILLLFLLAIYSSSPTFRLQAQFKVLLGLATSLSRGKTGKEETRETCNTWHAH